MLPDWRILLSNHAPCLPRWSIRKDYDHDSYEWPRYDSNKHQESYSEFSYDYDPYLTLTSNDDAPAATHKTDIPGCVANTTTFASPTTPAMSQATRCPCVAIFPVEWPVKVVQVVLVVTLEISICVQVGVAAVVVSGGVQRIGVVVA